MSNTFNPNRLVHMIDGVKHKRLNEKYIGGKTSFADIKTRMMEDIHREIMDHAGPDECNCEKQLPTEINCRKEACIISVVECYWEGEIHLAPYLRGLIKKAIDEVLEDSRQNGKIKDVF